MGPASSTWGTQGGWALPWSTTTIWDATGPSTYHIDKATYCITKYFDLGKSSQLKQTEEFWPGPLHQKHATVTLLNQFSSNLQVLSAKFKKETCVSTTVLVIHILAPWFEFCIHAFQTIGWMQERFILGSYLRISIAMLVSFFSERQRVAASFTQTISSMQERFILGSY